MVATIMAAMYIMKKRLHSNSMCQVVLPSAAA